MSVHHEFKVFVKNVALKCLTIVREKDRKTRPSTNDIYRWLVIECALNILFYMYVYWFGKLKCDGFQLTEKSAKYFGK